jgi:endo-1,4-beta-xylanase
MVKFSWQRLRSRRQFLLVGVSTTTAFAVLALGQLKVLSYLIYTFKTPSKIGDRQQRKFTVVGKQSLKQRAKNKGVLYGAYPGANGRQFSQDRQLQSNFVRECALMTIGYYWIGTRPSVDTFNFTGVDYFVKFAATHKLLLHGHPLVWHKSLPDWLPATLNRQNARQIVTNHIQTIVRRYAGKIGSWDVVNEAILPSDQRADGLRKTHWLQFLGEDYVDFAFRIAAKADPKAQLVYNEYGLEADTPEDETKRQAVLNLLERLKFKGTPIHALGIQSHLSTAPNFNPAKFREFLRQVASLGLKIRLSELDVREENVPMDLNSRDRLVAGAYEDFLSTALAEKSVIAVTSWGLSDRYTWIVENAGRTDRTEMRPLPFDRQHQPKLVWNGIARAFDRAPNR